MAKRNTVSVGHNSGISGEKLKNFIKQIEEAEDAKDQWGEVLKDIYTEVKFAGMDTKTVKKIVKARRADREKLREEKELLQQYAFVVDPELAEVLS